MNTKCPRCGANASWTITGLHSYSITTGSDVTLNCPVLTELLKQQGSVGDFNCKTLDEAVNKEVQEFRRKHPSVVFAKQWER